MRFLKTLLFLIMTLTAINAQGKIFKLNTPNKGLIEVKEVSQGMAFTQFKNKVVVLAFIAYNGKPCLNLIKTLNEMKKRHKDFDAFAVEMRKLTGEELNRFAKSKSIDFPIIGYPNAVDFTNYVAKSAGWNGAMPFILLIDKKGIVRYIQIGLVPLEGFEKAYQELK